MNPSDESPKPRPAIHPPVAQPEAMSQATPEQIGRRDFLKMFGYGAATLAAGGSALGLKSFTEKLQEENGWAVSYQAAPEAEAQGVVLQPAMPGGSETFALKTLGDRSARKMIVDGNRHGFNEIEVKDGTRELHLNQIYLSGIVGLELVRGSKLLIDAKGQEAIQHEYRLRMTDAKNGNPVEIAYRPAPQPVKERTEDRIETQDGFPDLHFFKADGRQLDFTIRGADLVADMPPAILSTPKSEEPVIAPVTLDRDALLDPYLGMRVRAEHDKDYAERTFRTDAHPVPLSEQPDPTAFVRLANALGAAKTEARKQGNSLF